MCTCRAKAEESGTISGQLIVDYWKANPKADKNGDGKSQYVLLQGEPGHQDAELRKFSVQAIQDAGIEVEALAVDTAMWDRVKDRRRCKPSLHPMATRLKRFWPTMTIWRSVPLKHCGGLLQRRQVYAGRGCRCDSSGHSGAEDGTLLGTVLMTPRARVKLPLRFAAALSKGETPNKDNTGFDITDGKYVWIAYKK